VARFRIGRRLAVAGMLSDSSYAGCHRVPPGRVWDRATEPFNVRFQEQLSACDQCAAGCAARRAACACRLDAWWLRVCELPDFKKTQGAVIIMFSRILRTLVLATLVLGCAQLASAKTFITIGSGSTTGLYYPTAVGIAKIVNESDLDMRANARSTGASVFNCRAVGSGQLQMGISQNNIAYYAYNGTGVEAFDGKPVENLRGVAVLYPETIQVLARKDANIDSLDDMKDKRVYVGDIGSGTEQDVKNVFGAFDMSLDDLKTPVRGSAGSAVGLLRDGQIDAMFYTVGLGASAITEAAQTAPINLVSIKPEKIEQLHEKYPFYTQIKIPGGTYPGIDEDATSITLKAMLLTSSDMSKDDVYGFMNTVFNKKKKAFYNDIPNPNLKKYFTLDSALDGMSIPLHPGAVKFFKEQGVDVKDSQMPPS
jgi:TRAP transporter solute receptor, TAXI family